MSGTVYVGAIGTKVTLDMGEDLTAAGFTSVKIEYRKPDGTTEGIWDAAIVDITEDEDGNTVATPNQRGIEYVTATAADLDQSEGWLLHPWGTSPTWEGLGRMRRLHVHAKWAETDTA